MSKFFILCFMCFAFINSVKSQPKIADTMVMFINSRGYSVRTIDSAEYFMLILPPDSSDNRNNVKGFYKDGKIKFVGKDAPNNNSLKTGAVLLDGNYISYY